MNSHEEKLAALKAIQQTILNCERMVPKFADGTAQATLLKNRIQALRVAKQLIESNGDCTLSSEAVTAARAPIASIIHKTSVARAKYEVGSAMDRRTRPLLDAMIMAQTYLEDFDVR